MKSQMPLCLASTSPRRREILASIGLDFTVDPVVTDEERLPDEPDSDLVVRLASDKAQAASDNYPLVLGADTVVVIDDQILGKPRDRHDALAMLAALSGRSHSVMTGVALRSASGLSTALSTTRVDFREIGRDEAERYWQSGEPCDKAGSYGIQGVGGMFVRSITGSFSGVVGLPVFETVRLLQQAGVEVPGPVHSSSRS